MRGLNQNELARRAGISVFQLNRIERGARDAKVSTVARLAQALGVDLAEVFTREEVDIPA